MKDSGPIKGGGNIPKRKTNINQNKKTIKSKQTVKKVIDSYFFKTTLSLIPLFSLFITVLCTNYYYFFNDTYFKYYDLISYVFGFSIFSLPAYFFIVYRYDFCNYSKFSLFGLLLYVIINVVWFFIDLFFSIKQNIYTNIFESFSITVLLFFSLYFLIKKEK